MLWIAQALIGKSSDLGDLVRAYAVGLHQLPTLISTVGRKLPIGVIRASAERLRIRMPLDIDFVGKLTQFACQKRKNLSSIGCRLGAAAIEERSRFRFTKFNPQTFRADGHLNMAF